MKAITLHQPWASLVAAGLKQVETRGWPTRHRGPLAIHAAARVPRYVYDLIDEADPARAPWLASAQMLTGWKPEQRALGLPAGCVVATCELAGCVPTEQVLLTGLGASGWAHAPGFPLSGRPPQTLLSPLQAALGDLGPGRWAWLLDDLASLLDRCPLCRGGKRVADERPGARRSFGMPVEWRECPCCAGLGFCDAIPALGRQQLWNWNPTWERT